ncbi:MAG TPA: hypothetical protein VGK91_00840 [Candidatus Udaeobacter sp.]
MSLTYIPNSARYTQALIDYATQIDDVGPLVTLRDALWTKLQTSDGKTLVVASPGGKSFQFEITMTLEDQFAAVVAAIKAFNDEAGDSPITFPDFSQMT